MTTLKKKTHGNENNKFVSTKYITYIGIFNFLEEYRLEKLLLNELWRKILLPQILTCPVVPYFFLIQ